MSHAESTTTGGGIVAGNTRIPKAELTGIYGAVVKRMSRKILGEVAEPVEADGANRTCSRR
nr:hypothetical protein JVH1_1291 [Rhodococcus sp. JVH1]